MPIYTVEIDGKQYDLEGDHEPNEQEAREAVSNFSPQKPQPQQNILQQLLSNMANPVQGLANTVDVAMNKFPAAVRSGIMGQGMQEGFNNPEQTPTFTKSAQQQLPIRADNIGTFVKDLAIRGPMQLGANIVDEITNPVNLAMDIGGIMGGMKLASKIPEVAESIAQKSENTAGRIINQMIKPSHKDFMFGKNPGLGIAKEGITASSMEELATKVTQKKDLLNQQIATIRTLPENINKTVKLSDSLKPLRDAYHILQRDPKTHSAEITKLQNIIDDLTGISKGKFQKLNNISIDEAYQIKDRISKMQSWKVDTEGGKLTNIALRKAYHAVDSEIDKAIPQLQQLNSRLSNMISAEQSIYHRIETLQRSDPNGWSQLANLPFALAKSTTSRTNLAKFLASRYKP